MLKVCKNSSQLSQEETTGPNLIGSSLPIINWSTPMHQTNVATSSFLSPQAATTTKTQQEEMEEEEMAHNGT
jgi:hypothetical protein